MMACCENNTDVMSRDKRVTLQSPKASPVDASGHVDLSDADNWQGRGQLWVKVMTRGGSEGYRFKQVQAEVTHLVEMSSTSLTRGIKPSWRILMGGRVLDIRSAYDVDEMRQTVRCECVEQVQ